MTFQKLKAVAKSINTFFFFGFPSRCEPVTVFPSSSLTLPAREQQKRGRWHRLGAERWALGCSLPAPPAAQGSDRSWWQPNEPQVNGGLHAESKVDWGNPSDNSGPGLRPCTPMWQLWQGLTPSAELQWGSWAMAGVSGRMGRATEDR